MKVRRILNAYLLIFGSLWLTALVAVLIRGHVLHRPYPYNTLLFIPEVQFTDFTIFYPRFAVWDRTYAFFTHTGFPFFYPPPVLAISLMLWTLAPDPLAAYLTVVAVFAFGAGFLLAYRRPLLQLPVALTLLGAYPLYFLLDRANLEGLVWMAAVTGVWAFTTRRLGWAAAGLGLAASMKLFPALLLLLFVARRRYGHFAMAIGCAGLFTLASAWFVGPSAPGVIRSLIHASAYFRENVILTYVKTEIGFEHSLLSCIKQAMHVFVRSPERMHAILPAVYAPYFFLAAAGCAALYWFRIRRLPVLNQLFALSALSVSLPFISFDYTLVHIYIPWAVFLVFLSTDAALSMREAMAFLVPCAVIFAPLSWLIVGGGAFGAQVKTVALAALVVAAVKIPLRSSIFEDDSTPATASRRTALQPLVVLRPR